MKKALFVSSLALLMLPVVAQAEGNAGHVYYDNGTNFEFPDAGFDMKLNFLLQGRYSYQSYDGDNDVNEFETRRARMFVSGNALEKKVTYMIQTDFVTDESENDGRDDNDLQDAWLQWNLSDDAGIRMGQMLLPFNRQFGVNRQNLQFTERSIASELLGHNRNIGVMYTGKSDGLGYSAGVYNGESSGEGINRAAVDNNVLGAFGINYTDGDYDRTTETYPDSPDGSGWTVGAAVTVGQGEVGDKAEKFDQVGLNADIGFRTGGFTLQSEYYYQQRDPDAGDSVDAHGLYAQAGFFVVPEEWEVAGRFSGVFADSDSKDPDLFEYSAVVNRYLLGNNLKVQAGVTFLSKDPESGSSTDDVIVGLQVGAFI